MQRKKSTQQLARIRVVGIGSGGQTAVNGLVTGGVYGVDYVTIDTDTRIFSESKAPHQIRIGDANVDANGTAGSAERGRTAALGSLEVIGNTLYGSDLVFILVGLGGGTGTGAAPIVAQAARSKGALVVGIVTYPFPFEGESRIQTARQGVAQLRNWSDTLIVIPNERLLEQSSGALGFHETYRLAHLIWQQSIHGISELVNHSGLINVDFADVRAIVSEGGGAIIANGTAQGKDRAQQAAEQATHSDLLGITIDGAHGLLFNVCGSADLSLLEVEQAADIITSRAHPNANVIFGAAVDPALEDQVNITVLATGFTFSRTNKLLSGKGIRRFVNARSHKHSWQVEPAPISDVNVNS